VVLNVTPRDLRDRIEVEDDLALLGITFGPLEPTSPPAHRGVVLPTSERPWRPMPARDPLWLRIGDVALPLLAAVLGVLLIVGQFYR
jgi:hypothetical protein